jgi:hypothetical protein
MGLQSVLLEAYKNWQEEDRKTKTKKIIASIGKVKKSTSSKRVV